MSATIHEQLRQYLYDRSSGVVNLTPIDCEKLIAIVKAKQAAAVLYKFDNQLGEYKLYQHCATNNDSIMRALAQYKPDQHVEGFYRWDLFDDKGQFIKSIFTINSLLF